MKQKNDQSEGGRTLSRHYEVRVSIRILMLISGWLGHEYFPEKVLKTYNLDFHVQAPGGLLVKYMVAHFANWGIRPSEYPANMLTSLSPYPPRLVPRELLL